MPRSGDRPRFSFSRRSREEFAMQVPRQDLASKPLTKVGEVEAARIRTTWQAEAFLLCASVGEVGYVLNMTANVVSRGVLIPQRNTDEGWVKVDEPELLRATASLVSPGSGQQELLRRMALITQIAGEGYLIGENVYDDIHNPKGVVWEFLSTQELKIDKGKVIRKPQGYGQSFELPANTFIARLLQSAPDYSDIADSVIKRLMPILREIVLLTQVVDAIAKSRLSAGIFFIPEEISAVGASNEWEDPSNPATGDEFEDVFIRQITAPIEDRSDASSLVPLIMTGPADLYGKMGLVETARGLDSLYANLRAEALRRLSQGLNVPPELLEGKGGLNHWCVSDDTEVMTMDRGWITQNSLLVGDVVLTLNHDSGLSEWKPVESIYRAEVEGESMVSITGARHSSLTTPNHRWPTLHGNANRKRIWTTSDKLNSLDSLVVAAASDEQPSEQKWSDDIVELAAWLWAEGNIRFRPGRHSAQVTIWQSNSINPDNVARIRRALTGVFGSESENFGHGSAKNIVPAWRSMIRLDRPEMVEFKLNSAAANIVCGLFTDPGRKILDLSFIREMTLGQLELFIDASIRADGTVLPSGGCLQIAQNDCGRLAPIELAAILSGRSTSIYPIPNGMTMLSISSKTLFRISGKKIDETSYTGTIWCPVTANKSWFARRQGKTFYTGNTGYNVDQDYLTRHVQPLAELLTDFLSQAYLRPMLVAAEGFLPEDAQQYRLWLDLSKVQSRVNAGDSARQAYDRFGISLSTYLRENGLDNGDMPSEEESRRRFLTDLVRANPGYAKVILPEIYPELADIASKLPDPTAPGGGHSQPGAQPPPGVPRAEEPPQIGEPSLPEGKGSSQKSISSDSALIDRLATAASGELDRSLERAANRLISKLQGIDKEMAQELSSISRYEVLTKAGEKTVSATGMSISDLFNGSWDHLIEEGSVWVQTYLEDNGVSPLVAEEQARIAMVELAGLLTFLASSSIRQPMARSSNGLKVSHELISKALEATALVQEFKTGF